MIEEDAVAAQKNNASRFRDADAALAAFMRRYDGPVEALAIFRAFAHWLCAEEAV